MASLSQHTRSGCSEASCYIGSVSVRTTTSSSRSKPAMKRYYSSIKYTEEELEVRLTDGAVHWFCVVEKRGMKPSRDRTLVEHLRLLMRVLLGSTVPDTRIEVVEDVDATGRSMELEVDETLAGRQAQVLVVAKLRFSRQSDGEGAVLEMLSSADQHVRKLVKKEREQRDRCKELEASSAQIQALQKDIQRVSKEREQDLMQRFRAVLNAKKAKIRQLEARLAYGGGGGGGMSLAPPPRRPPPPRSSSSSARRRTEDTAAARDQQMAQMEAFLLRGEKAVLGPIVNGEEVPVDGNEGSDVDEEDPEDEAAEARTRAERAAGHAALSPGSEDDSAGAMMPQHQLSPPMRKRRRGRVMHAADGRDSSTTTSGTTAAAQVRKPKHSRPQLDSESQSSALVDEEEEDKEEEEEEEDTKGKKKKRRRKAGSGQDSLFNQLE